MKNLNSSYTQSESIFSLNLCFKLNKLLTICEYCNSDISHVYLTEQEARHLSDDTALFQYYQFRFNDLGVELVCPRARRELQ